MAAEFKYDVVEELGVLSENPSNGWKREINLVSFNDRGAKYDIRDWAPKREKMSKGISLTIEEAKMLKEILNNLEL